MHYLDLDILLNLDKMAGLLSGDPSHQEMLESGSYGSSRDNLVEPDNSSFNWFFTRNEIEENSPSRRDGIDLKKENKFRTSYSTFIQDLGMRLEVPQATIATAIIFCHRFFLHQSHAKNDRWTIAIACMFLAGKVEGTPRSLWNVILISYELRYRKAVQGHNQRILVFKQQRELILLGERVVLSTLGFDLIVHHPYKPLIKAIKNFKVEKKKALLQAAWNFVNDGLRTSLFLQFKSHHIAAGAIFLAAKFVKVELPTDGEVVWWQEFDVTPRQLIEMSHQMLDLYEQDQASQGTKVEGSTGTGSGLPQTNYHNQGPSQASLKVPFSSEKPKASIIGLSHERRQNHEEDGRDHRMAKDPQHHGDHQAQRGHIPRTRGWYEQNRVQRGHIPRMRGWYEQSRASKGTKVRGSTGTGSGLPQTTYHNQGPSQASAKVPVSSKKPKAFTIGLSHQQQNHEEDGRDHRRAKDPQHHGDHQAQKGHIPRTGGWYEQNRAQGGHIPRMSHQRQNHEEDGRDHRRAKDPQHHGDHQAQRGHIPRTGGWYEQNRVQGGHIPRMRGWYEHNWAQRGHIPRTRGWYEQNRASQETKRQGSTGTGCSLPQTNYHNQSPSQASAKVLVSSEEPKAAKVLVSSEEPKAAKVPVSSKKPKASTIGSPHQQRQNHEEDGRDHQMATDPQHHGDH